MRTAKRHSGHDGSGSVVKSDIARHSDVLGILTTGEAREREDAVG